MCARHRGLRLRGLQLILVAACSSLIGCSWPGAKHDPNPQVYGLYDRVPQGGGRYKIGEPYRVGSEWFYPREDPHYDHTGIASWYGEYFHGRKTANGEWYDMNRMSAAHPTLPLPVYARVTNMQNGRSVVVRVNDRGPFKRGRIIDLSKAAATRLGIVKTGTGPVRVTYIGRAPLAGDVANMQTVDRRGRSWFSPFSTASVGAEEGSSAAPAASRSAAMAAPAATGAVAPRTEVASSVPAASGAPQRIVPSGLYVQVASFTSETQARSLAQELSHLGSFAVLPAEVAGDTYYRVRLGPVASYADAQSMVSSLESAGLPGGRIFEQ